MSVAISAGNVDQVNEHVRKAFISLQCWSFSRERLLLYFRSLSSYSSPSYVLLGLYSHLVKVFLIVVLQDLQARAKPHTHVSIRTLLIYVCFWKCVCLSLYIYIYTETEKVEREF